MIKINIQKELYGRDGTMELKVNITIDNGDFIALNGASGSGKTTLLRILAGLEEANGSIIIDNETWLNSKSSLPIQKRGIGFVFQEYALFDNMSIEENLLYANRDKDLAKELLEVTELSNLKQHSPKMLSGGQKQRVSLCRALMKRPKLLLMDEPLSALDPTMRAKLQNEILQLHKEFATTTIMVSHDPSEIYKLANRVITLQHGKVINDDKTKNALLKRSGSQKISFTGEILDIEKIDAINVAIVAIGQQIVEVVLSKQEAKQLKIGQKVTLNTKAFSPTLKNISNNSLN